MVSSGLLNELDILHRLYDPDDAKRLVITPIISPKDQFQPASFDLRLGTEFLIIKNAKFKFMDLLEDEKDAIIKLNEYVEFIQIPPDGEFVLHPQEFSLGCTLEYIRLPNDIAGRLEGKSTWGRIGLQVHSTAGFVDPGFAGALTFELQNIGGVPIPLYPGLIVGQICFFKIFPSSIPYRKKVLSNYGGWPGVQGSRYYRRDDIKRLRNIHNRSPKVPEEG